MDFNGLFSEPESNPLDELRDLSLATKGYSSEQIEFLSEFIKCHHDSLKPMQIKAFVASWMPKEAMDYEKVSQIVLWAVRLVFKGKAGLKQKALISQIVDWTTCELILITFSGMV